MHIKMLETRRGSEDSFTLSQYHRGDIYEVADNLARSFIGKGWAMEIAGEVIPPAPVSQFAMAAEGLAQANADFNRIFRPQPTRGSAPTNPSTLMMKGEL